MESPRISVVTPSFNQVEYIEDTIRSVMDQEYADVEHVVVDGGSTDGTVNILRQYESEYDLRWISEPDRGQSHAINKGIEMAEGELIGWQNSDDYYLSGCFSRVAETVTRHPDVDLVYGDVLQVDRNGDQIRKVHRTRPSELAHRYGRNFALNQSSFFHRRVFEDVGLLDEDLEYVMDAEFYWRLLQADVEMIHIPALMGARRLHNEAKMMNSDNAAYQSERARLERMYDYTQLEQAAPLTLLAFVGLLVHLWYLFREGQVDAATYTASDVLQKFLPV